MTMDKSSLCMILVSSFQFFSLFIIIHWLYNLNLIGSSLERFPTLSKKKKKKI
jgi:hypothetical protein